MPPSSIGLTTTHVARGESVGAPGVRQSAPCYSVSMSGQDDELGARVVEGRPQRLHSDGVQDGGQFNVCYREREFTVMQRPHRVAILIPFRNRWNHLKILLQHLHPILQRQQINYQIFIIEQSGRDTFNKGRVFNYQVYNEF